MKTKTFSHYAIHINDGEGSLSQDGYSKYNERFKMATNKEIRPEQIYGLEQVLDHLQEVRNTKGEYSDYWKTVKLDVVKITTTTEYIDIEKIKSVLDLYGLKLFQEITFLRDDDNDNEIEITSKIIDIEIPFDKEDGHFLLVLNEDGTTTFVAPMNVINPKLQANSKLLQI